MLALISAAVTPREVFTGNQFMVSISVTEVATTWEDLMNEVSNWGTLIENYLTWKQVKQR